METIINSNGLKFSGIWGNGIGKNKAYNCYINSTNQWYNQGCSQIMSNDNSFGKHFNKNNGGYFVLLWDTKINNLINIWYFNKTNIPNELKFDNLTEIANININPINIKNWGIPDIQYLFGNHCPSNKIKKNHIVINTNFCGDWAGHSWTHDEYCSTLADTCKEFVAQNPSYFKNAYWDINFLRVYTF